MIKWEREAAVECQKCWVATGECRIWWKFTQEPATFTCCWGGGGQGTCRDILPSLTCGCTTSISPPRQSTAQKKVVRPSSGAVEASGQRSQPRQIPRHEMGCWLHGTQEWLLPQHLLISGDYLPRVISCCSSGLSPAALDTWTWNQKAGSKWSMPGATPPGEGR